MDDNSELYFFRQPDVVCLQSVLKFIFGQVRWAKYTGGNRRRMSWKKCLHLGCKSVPETGVRSRSVQPDWGT